MLSYGLLLCISFQINLTFGHVALTYPEARRVDYNFQDNARTPPPCGGQPKAAPLAEFREGENVTITWNLAYPHNGGYRIELLPESDNITEAQVLFPLQGEWHVTNDTTESSQMVTLPSGVTCDNCTVRLVRQALEWGSGYIFWTCADVRIVNKTTQFCSGHGTYSEGKCVCDKLYSGDRCQNWDECESDTDCNEGLCVDTYAQFSPRMQCFCKAGYFGEGCKQVSSVKTLDGLDLSTHREEPFSDNYKLYHKVMGDEIEMVIKAKTISWVGIGWRPQGELKCSEALSSVHSKPEREGEPEPNNSTKPEPEGSGNHSQPEPETKTTPEAEVTPEPGAKPEVNATSPEPEGISTSPELEGDGADNYSGPTVIIHTDVDYLKSQGLDPSLATYECKPLGRDKGSPEPEGTGEPEGSAEPNNSTAEPHSEPGNSTAEPHSEPGNSTSEPESKPESTAEPGSKPETTAEPESKPEGTAKPEGTSSEPEGEHTGDEYHPMNCVDMVTAAAHGSYGRVFDSYSRDRSTPKTDVYYGGQNSLTAAIASEENGETTVLIRRKIEASEPLDYTLLDEDMQVIWALGQKHLHYSHNGVSGIDRCLAKDYFYYRNDVLLYHGKEGQRGTADINFISRPTIVGGANRYELDSNNYVEWSYDLDTKTVTFTVTAQLSSGDWLALGVSDNKAMIDTDVVHMGISSATSQPVLSDRYITGYSLPPVDQLENDGTTYKHEYKNGVLTATVIRPINTQDDDDLTLDECRYLIFASGKGFDGKNFSKHAEKKISPEKVCFVTENTTPKIGPKNPVKGPGGSGVVLVPAALLISSSLVFGLLC